MSWEAGWELGGAALLAMNVSREKRPFEVRAWGRKADSDVSFRGWGISRGPPFTSCLWKCTGLGRVNAMPPKPALVP